MCYPALLNYASIAVLIPAGAYAVLKSSEKRQLFASAPMVFGLQQLLIGVMWICINANYIALAHNVALLYLFVMYFWWPAILPAAVYRIQSHSQYRLLLRILFFLGLLLGLATYAPVLAGLKSFSLSLVGKAITISAYTEFWQQCAITFCYLMVVVTSLLVALFNISNWFVFVLLDALLVGLVWCAVMFTNVWCYLPLLLALYMLFTSLQRRGA